MGFLENNSNWKGGRHLLAGRPMILNYDHPRSHPNGYVFEHIVIAEKALGKSLPQKVDIHHVDGNRANNTNSNLVVCENRAYHALLHRRTRALQVCGNPNWRKCLYCKKWDDPENMYCNGHYAYHRFCKNKYQNQQNKRGQVSTMQSESPQKICASLPHNIKKSAPHTTLLISLHIFF